MRSAHHGKLRPGNGGQRANLELTELRSAVGEDAVDRGHATAQIVGSAELIDRRAQDGADRVADTRSDQQKDRYPKNMRLGEKQQRNAVDRYAKRITGRRAGSAPAD